MRAKTRDVRVVFFQFFHSLCTFLAQFYAFYVSFQRTLDHATQWKLEIYWKPQSPSGIAFVDSDLQPPESLKSTHGLKCGIVLCVSTAAASTYAS